MKHFRSWAVSALAGAMLLACGGGDPYVAGSDSPSGAPTTRGSFTAVVSFGDSLSDVGTYTVATSIAGNGTAPYLGGKWTTNTTPNTATIWIENLATTLGVVVPTPAEAGFGGASQQCPSADNTCTAYGQGGSLVTNPNGLGHSGGAGALTVPLKTQIERHLARFNEFKPTDLVLVWGGANEVFSHFETFGNAANAIFTRAGLGEITSDQAKALVLNAQLDALGKMKAAALELAGYVKTQMLAKGARYVAVINLPDFNDTPFGAGYAANPATAPIAPILSALPANFNLWLREGLVGQPVQIIDAWSLIKQVKASPGSYGIVNMSTPTCNFAVQDAVLGRVLTTGRALFCNVTPGAPFDMRAPGSGADPNTWFFADDAHPSVGGHRVIAQEFAKQLRAFGWIN